MVGSPWLSHPVDAPAGIVAVVKNPLWSYEVKISDPEPVQEAAGEETETCEGTAEVDRDAGSCSNVSVRVTTWCAKYKRLTDSSRRRRNDLPTRTDAPPRW